jgi:ABC-type polysaccharide/polyol phosphate transport system ATPase subunit
LREGTISTSEVWKRFRTDSRPTFVQDQIGRLADRVRGRAGEGWRWVLREIDFRAEPGESWGLVGANGAGKSTLLKILTRVMYPTAGRVQVAGRVGALIEVRAGISPFLTGRENIQFTGTLMGLKRSEIARRFDEIVEFAGLQNAIDRQVKYYSSGMQMRLGFAVAAYLEPDVLLVDEVLAVGDAAFQQRCLERMRQVLAQGTTLVLVSHDLAAVEGTCRHAIWLSDGNVRASGPVRDVLGEYRRSVEQTEVLSSVDGRLRIRELEVGSDDAGGVRTGGELGVRLRLESDESYRAWLYLGVSEGLATPIFLVNPGREISVQPGEVSVSCTVAPVPLPLGRYRLWCAAYQDWENGPELLRWHPVAEFQVHGPRLDHAPRSIVRLSPVHVESSWTVSVNGNYELTSRESGSPPT